MSEEIERRAAGDYVSNTKPGPVRAAVRADTTINTTNGGAGPITDSDVESVYPGDAWDGREGTA